MILVFKGNQIRVINSFMTGPYHIEPNPLTCSANQWTRFYMIGTSVMKELIKIEVVN